MSIHRIPTLVAVPNHWFDTQRHSAWTRRHGSPLEGRASGGLSCRSAGPNRRWDQLKLQGALRMSMLVGNAGMFPPLLISMSE